VHKLIAILLSATVLLIGCQPADPVKSASPELQRQYNAAFQDMLNKPGDLAVALKYANVANQAGDLEGAISTYEGMLLIDSNLPRVRLELGILYYRLKSYEVSRTYLETALQSPTLPADVRKPAEQLLLKMPKQSKRST
jgi:tetratricopeptide (TPR) repeat protein